MTAADPSTKVDESPPRWSGELIAGLDWKRIAELARALSSSYGFKLGRTTVGADGGTDFIITRGSGPDEPGTLVRLTRWNQWMCSGECLTQFAQDLGAQEGRRGIFISPGGFAPSAQRAAQKSGIEMVDAETLALRLNGLPPQHRAFYFNLATAGEATIPSCPVCLEPLKLGQDSDSGALNGSHHPELRYTTSDIVGGAVRARRIEVLPFCEVQFLQEVRTGDLVVHGVVTGDFVCEGSVVLHPGAMLRGSVAAHSVIVRPGADLQGETRILNGKLESFGRTASEWLWRCESPKSRPGCEAVSFQQH
jgi:hypothetical protein